MAKKKDNQFCLMDFVNRKGLKGINGIYGEECLKKYLDDSTSYAAGVEKEIDALRKNNVAQMLSLLSNEVDVSEFDPLNFGIGYNELRYLSIDSNGNPVFESNNVRDLKGNEDEYRTFTWEELTDYEKSAIEDILKQIVKQILAA